MKSVAFYCVFLFGSMCGTVSDPVASNLHIASSSLHETRAGLLASCFFPGAFLFADGICGYPNGWYLNGNACLACSAGTYSLETNMNNCIAFASARTICALSYPSALSIALHFSTPPKVVGSKLIAAGGEVDLIYYAAADLLDLESGVWSTSSLSLARDNYGVAALLDNFFVAAGDESDRCTFTASADALNVKLITWTNFRIHFLFHVPMMHLYRMVLLRFLQWGVIPIKFVMPKLTCLMQPLFLGFKILHLCRRQKLVGRVPPWGSLVTFWVE